MFSKQKQQFISLYQVDNQLKIGYQVYERHKLLINQTSSVLSSKERLPKELEMIFEAKQSEIKESYISTLIDCKSEKLILATQTFDSDKFAMIELSDEYKIIAPKIEVVKTAHFFANAGIDYVFSPAQILRNLFLEHPSNDTLNILLLNDKIHIMHISKDNKIIYVTEKMTKFSDISKSEFFDSEINEQKLYDEIYYLEILAKISSVIEANQLNIYKLSIYYDIKQLSSADLQNFEDYFAVATSYKKANILDSILHLITSKQKHKSYVIPRSKKSSKVLAIGIIGAIFSGMLAFFAVYFVNAMFENEPVKKVQAKPIVKTAILPSHKTINESLIKELNFLFDSIPASATLNSVVINSKGSVLECDFANKIAYQKEMNGRLLLFYQKSKIDYKSAKSPYFAIVANEVKLDANMTAGQTKEYKYEKKYDEQTAQKIISGLLSKNAKIEFQTQMDNTKFSTFVYKVQFLITSPKEFFDFVESLNRLNYSIHLSEPVSFSKSENGIEIQTMVLFNQAKQD